MKAVKAGNVDIINILLTKAKKAVAPTLSMRDYSGATPLHIAILQGFSEVVSILVAASPPDVLYVENGVGATPLELAKLAALNVAVRNSENSSLPSQGFSIYGSGNLPLEPAPSVKLEDEAEIAAMQKVIEKVKATGALAKKPELLEVLSKFVEQSASELAAVKAENQAADVEMETDEAKPAPYGRKDTLKPTETLQVFQKAVVAIHQRTLVHLHDVQQAVLTAVEREVASRSTRAYDPDAEPVEDTTDKGLLLKNVNWASALDHDS